MRSASEDLSSVPGPWKRDAEAVLMALFDTRGQLTLGDAVELFASSQYRRRSKRHLRRIFLLTTGQSFRKARHAIKMGYARQLVRDTSLGFDEIANELRYASGRTRFEDVYLKFFGITPAADRNHSEGSNKAMVRSAGSG